MSTLISRRADSARRQTVRVNAYAVASATLGCAIFLTSCVNDLGVTVDADGTPEDRWEVLDPTASLGVGSPGGSDPVVGAVLPDPITIHVTDKNGRPFSGLTVTWTVSDPTGGVATVGLLDFSETLATVLDAQGKSSVSWQVGTAAGSQSINARIVGPGRGRYKNVTTNFETMVVAGAPYQLAVAPDQIQLDRNDDQALNADVVDEYGNDVEVAVVTWASADETIATVDDAGMVTGMDAGSTLISASVANLVEGATVLVSSDSTVVGPPALSTLNISPRALFGSSIGETIQLNMNATDSLGNPITPLVAWASTDPSVITVSGTGLVTAMNYGTGFVRTTSDCCTTDSVAVTIQESTGTEGLDWFCDWTGATGNSPAAYEGTNSTGACFTGVTSSAGDFLSVEAANPNHGFPATMTNVMRVEFVDADTKRGSKMVQAHQQWAAPEVGEYVYYRFYDYNDFGPGQPLHAHWFHGGSNQTGSDYGGGLWALSSGRIAADLTYDINFGVGYQPSGSSGRGQGYFRMYSTMEARKLYRREHRIHRTDADSVRHQVRISDGVTGELLFTSADFTCVTAETGGCVDFGGFASDTLGQYKAWHNGPNSLNSMEVGNNGANEGFRGLDPTTPQFWYIGGMAVRVTADPNAWIGSYPAAGSNEGN